MAFADVIGRAVVVVSGQVDPKSIDTTSGKLGASLKKTALIGVAAFGTIAAAGIKAASAAEEAASVQRKLNNVLANMGKTGAVGQINDFTDALMRKTGVDDEVIKKGQTILATFSQVADSAGKVGGAFQRASELTLDLAEAGFGNVDGAAKALGKALQDPIKGISGLSRAGVTFTATQKEQIENFIKTGDVASAQNEILKEVEKQVGGTAEAGAQASERLGTALGELNESIGGLLIGDSKGKKTVVDVVADSVFNLSDEVSKLGKDPDWIKFKEDLKEINKDLGGGGGGSQYQAPLDITVGLAALSEGIKQVTGLLSGDSPLAKDIADGGLWDTASQALADFEADIRDGGLIDSVSSQLEGAETSVSEFATTIKTRFHEGWEAIKTDAKRGLDDVKAKISAFPGEIKKKGSEWAAAGSKLIGDFVGGLITGNVGSQIGDRIRKAINDALPNSITFFGKAGGVPAITVPVPQFASGVRNFGGGLALVGERGPELVGLPPGSDVYSNRESAGMAGNTYYQFFGPESLSQARRDNDWDQKYGTRFGAATQAAAL